MISFSCNACNKTFSVKDHLAGKKVKCPGCGQVVVIPALAAAPSAVAEMQPLPPRGTDASSPDQRTQPSPLDPSHGPTHPSSNLDATNGLRPFANSQAGLTDFLAPPQAAEELGRLGKYRILKVLGHGGMGVVFKAEDPKLKRMVAMKAMLPAVAASASAGQRFLREAQAMAAVEHDHIVRVYQVDEERGVPFMAMEFLKGEPLDERLKRKAKLPLGEVLRIGREVAEGLAAAHEKGLIHRDIKPANLWLEAPADRVKILDFGLARPADDDAHLTQEGEIVGTPAYMAPEQARGETVDARCDLFSLGVVLYRLCSGQQPFKGKDTVSTLLAVAMDEPAPPRQLNADVTPELSDLVMKLLQKAPERRLASAGEVVECLRILEKQQARRAEAAEHTGAYQAGSLSHPAPRRRLALVLTAVLLLAGLIGAGAWTLTRVPREPGDSIIAAPADVKGPAPRPDDAWIKQVAAMKPEEQVQAVAAKLKERNPGFDGKVTHKVEGGVVTELKFLTNHVTDISPVRALTGLQILICYGSGDWKPGSPAKGRLADLTPLKDMKLTKLNCGQTQVSDLTPLKDMNLTSLNCIITGVSDLTPLKGMKLESLEFGATNVSDLSPLKGMPLIELNCNCPKVSDLFPLKDMKLTRFQCNNTLVTDLTPLKNMKLTYLDCRYTPVSDLSPLKDMKLRTLWCDTTRVTNLSPLKGMPLKELRCDFQPARDADILRSIKTLETINGKPATQLREELELAQGPFEGWLKKVAVLPPVKQVFAVTGRLMVLNPGFDGKVTHKVEGGVVTELEFLTDHVTDISPVRALTGLRTLMCEGSPGKRKWEDRGKGQLADLSPLKHMKLTKLWCKWTQVSDLSPLKDMKLTVLKCDLTQVSDLSPVKDMKLTWLGCSYTQVSDLSPLKDMKLTSLSCSGTHLSDLSPLKNMKLTELWCYDTNLSDLSPLKDMKLTKLQCHATKVTDLSPLNGMPLKELKCDFQPLRDADILRSIKTLETINGTPAKLFWQEVDAGKPPPKP